MGDCIGRPFNVGNQGNRDDTKFEHASGRIYVLPNIEGASTTTTSKTDLISNKY
jgi:hypothetical protein